MIFGDCPYCGQPVWFAIPDDVALPALAKVDCEHCDSQFWERFSRIDPRAYRLDQVIVDEDTERVLEVREA
jgi:hypothetical protein